MIGVHVAHRGVELAAESRSRRAEVDAPAVFGGGVAEDRGA